MEDTFLLTTGISAIIGVIAPFAIPFVFKFVSKILKRNISKEEKRTVITLISMTVSAILIGINFKWVGDFDSIMKSLFEYFTVNFAVIKGMTQAIYEIIVKNISSLDSIGD